MGSLSAPTLNGPCHVAPLSDEYWYAAVEIVPPFPFGRANLIIALAEVQSLASVIVAEALPGGSGGVDTVTQAGLLNSDSQPLLSVTCA